jgi:hypothetical protein
MFRMAVGHSDDIDVERALDAVIEECETVLAGAVPRAGLLMASWDSDHRVLIDRIRGRYPGIQLAGATSAAEMSSILGFSEDSVALALFASDTIEVTAGLARELARDPVASIRGAVADARAASSLPPSLCIAMMTIGSVEASVILGTLRDALGPEVPILGGGAAPRDPATNPTNGIGAGRLIAGDVVTDDAVSILLFSGPLAHSYGVDTGWRRVGPMAMVTGVLPGSVTEIDGQPATAFYKRYLGTAEPAIANPMAVFDALDAQRFYLRTPIAYDEATGCVTFFGDVPLGSTVQLTIAATDEIFAGARASIDDALATYPAGHTPEAALIFSCTTRRFLLGTRAGREIDVVRGAVGLATPVAGVYCMGEIAPMAAGDPSRFHNATLVSVLLGSL